VRVNYLVRYGPTSRSRWDLIRLIRANPLRGYAVYYGDGPRSFRVLRTRLVHHETPDNQSQGSSRKGPNRTWSQDVFLRIGRRFLRRIKCSRCCHVFRLELPDQRQSTLEARFQRQTQGYCMPPSSCGLAAIIEAVEGYCNISRRSGDIVRLIRIFVINNDRALGHISLRSFNL